MPSSRKRNPRGQGSRLREEIVVAATGILEEKGFEDAVTLRGVARRIGVSAPSLYDHFSGQGEILAAVLARAFDQFQAALDAAARAPAGDPTQRLEKLATAYLEFARHHPQVYRIMFSRWRREGTAEMISRRSPEDLLGAAAFGLLVDAVAAADPTGNDSTIKATALWVGLHGYATLRDAVPAFPWPDEKNLLSRLLTIV